MQLLSKVEINYFRSLHKAILGNISDLNLVFGRNDSGKSNVLRALNLFFHDAPSRNLDLDFDVDLSAIRKKEIETSKGRQFISVRVDFNIPSNFERSLGQHLSLKRQWNLYGERTDIFPDLTTGQRIQLTKFLNQIDYTYIPAIKDNELYSDLVERLYSAIADSRDIVGATSGFIESIRSQTNDLSEALTKLFGSATKISTPTQMGVLFRSLDFAHGDDEHSLLLQKGDGVKARHIPELLGYINQNEKAKNFFIWGFEEPENSLDLGSADAEARSLALRSRRPDTQIFCTSHSPAFYLAGEDGVSDERVRRYFITKQVKTDGALEPDNAVLNIKSFSDAEAAMKEASLLQLPYLIKEWSKIKGESAKINDEIIALRKKVESLSEPTVFTEGAHDKALFERVASTISDSPLNFKTLGGTPKTASEYLRRLREEEVSPSSQMISFLFDNDPSGRAAYCALSKNKLPGAVPYQVSDNIKTWCLPVSTEWESFREEYGIPIENGIFEAEFLFDGHDAAGLLLSTMSNDELEQYSAYIHNDYHRSLSQKVANRLRSAPKGSAAWLWARGVPDTKKSIFNKQAAATLDTGPASRVIKALIA